MWTELNEHWWQYWGQVSQTRLTQMDDQILALYAKGISTFYIIDDFKHMFFGFDYSAGITLPTIA